MKRIMFVDDEPAILAGLQNLLYKDRKRWTLVFALASTVRIMLSGHADREAIVRALPALHQLLSKPCGGETLRAAIERSPDTELPARITAVVGRLAVLPTTAELHRRLERVLADTRATIEDLTAVIAADPGLGAKVQLVNSAYFGAGQVTSSIPRAVAMLGFDRIRYIASTISIFETLDNPLPGISIRALQDHALCARPCSCARGCRRNTRSSATPPRSSTRSGASPSRSAGRASSRSSSRSIRGVEHELGVRGVVLDEQDPPGHGVAEPSGGSVKAGRAGVAHANVVWSW